MVEGVVEHLHELLDRDIVGLIPAPVVADLDGELRIERMMGERSDSHVVIGVDLQGVAVRGGCILLPVHDKGLGTLAEICVQDALETVLPSSSEGPVGDLGNGLDIGLEHGVKLGLGRERSAVVHSGHLLERDDAVVTDHVQDIVGLGTCTEGEVAVQADVLVSPLSVGMAHHKEH